MTVFLAILLAVLVLGALVIFPVVGLALIPLVVIAFIAIGGWIFIVARREPDALPERRAPGEDL